jgi:hypothetical protein
VAAIRVEEKAFSDLRYQRLAHEAGLADADHARGKMLLLWRQCTIENTYCLQEDDIRDVLGERGVEAIVLARLGEPTQYGIRICGTDGRVEWLEEAEESDRRSAGGKARARTAKRNPDGSFAPKMPSGKLPNSSKHPAMRLLDSSISQQQPAASQHQPASPAAPAPAPAPAPAKGSIPVSTRSLDRAEIPSWCWKAADYLRDRILEKQPEHQLRRKSWDDGTKRRRDWANTFRLMASEDKREREKIGEMISWLFTSENRFVVQSPGSLRKKYDRIELAMRCLVDSARSRSDRGMTAREIADYARELEEEDE